MKAAPQILCSTQFEQASQTVRDLQCDCACSENEILFSPMATLIGTSLCDCACSENGKLFSPKSVSIDTPLQAVHQHIQKLSPEHVLMFNPKYTSGVVVLNRSARQIWEKFHASQSRQAFYSTSSELAIVQEMVEAGLLKQVGATIQPCKNAPHTLSVWLHVINDCNMYCDYCYISRTGQAMSLEMGHASVDAAIRSALRGGYKRIKLKFAGGEPTLKFKLILDLHQYALDQTARAGLELEAVILSNGTIMTEDTITALKTRDIHLMISLDGIGKMHDVQRRFAGGQGTFAAVSRTLDRLAVHGIKPFISITVSDRNAGGLADVVAYVLDRGLPFNLNFVRNNDCIANFEDLRLRDERIIKAIHKAFAVIESRLPTYSLLGSLVDRAYLHQPHDKSCAVGESYLVVDPLGNIAKCQMEISHPITNVYADDPLAQVKADQKGIQNISVEEKEGCRDCLWKYWCAGGCPLVTYRASGRFDVKSPYCRIYKAVFPELLRLEGLRLLKLGGVSQLN